MSGALATNFFLKDYSEAHREAQRAKAAAEGRTLSVHNPLVNRAAVAPPKAEKTQQKEKKQHWWSHKETARSGSIDSDGKSLMSFSSGSSR